MTELFEVKFLNMFAEALRTCINAPSSSHAAKAVYAGVRLMGRNRGSSPLISGTENKLCMYRAVLNTIGLLTPRQLLNVFPVEKRYNGERYSTKDYFSTMQALEVYGMDRLIGKNASSLLWDYANIDTRYFLVGYWNVLDELQCMGCEE